MTWLGLLAGALTTGSWLPQVMRSVRSGSSRDLSWIYLLTFLMGTTGWLGYGLVLGAVPVVAANVVTTALVLALCATKLAQQRLAAQSGYGSGQNAARPGGTAEDSLAGP
jgi:MtN3 and saliva related transmembrane protein